MFAIASVTKVCTGIPLAQAVVNGEVWLDDPISMVLPMYAFLSGYRLTRAPGSAFEYSNTISSTHA